MLKRLTHRIGSGFVAAVDFCNGRSRLARQLSRIEYHFGHLERRLDRIEQRFDPLERRLDGIEYFSHGARSTYVGGGRVLVKCVVGDANIAYLVEAEDRLISPWFIVSGRYETAVTTYFVRNLRKNSRCLDVGTNFGYFLGVMGRFCPEGRVVGLEPDRHVYELARDNIAINGFAGHVSVMHAAASDAGGTMTLHRRRTRSANTSIARLSEEFIAMMGEEASEAFTVDAVRLDDLLPRFDGRVDFLKIDVEGAEPLVFAGARDLIGRNPDMTIVMEWSPAQIEQAGLSVDAFLADLASLHLAPANIAEDGSTVPLTYAELRHLRYSAGIVLSADRRTAMAGQGG